MLGVRDDNRKWWILSAMGGVIFLVLLDETVVGIALPTITRDLGLSEISSHWVVNSYLLVFAGLVAAGGRLGDIFGLRVLFTLGILIFGLASLACGFMGDGTWLIIARCVQGVGAAIIFPASMAMIAIIFPEKERGMAIGIYGAIGTVGLTLGPLVGGYFSEAFSWRWIFWINPPIVILIAVLVLVAWIDPPLEKVKSRFDFQGLFSLIGGLGLFVFGLMQGPEWGWKDPAVWGCLVVGGLLFAVFVAIELRVKRPLIEVDLFANASFAVCNFVVFTAQYSKIVIFIFGAAYLQKNLEMTALEAGTALLASVIFSPPMGLVAGKVADRFGARGPTLIGLVAVTSALLWIGVASEWQSYLLLLPGLLIWGSAIPLLFVPPMRAVMNEVPADKKGLAGGIVLCAQLLGGTMGVAISSTLFLTTRDYSVVFLATGALAAFALLLGFLKIEPEKIEAA